MENLKDFSLEYYINLIEQSNIETDIITTLVENNIENSALLEKVQIKNGSMNLSLKNIGKKIKDLLLKLFLFFKKIFIAIKFKIKQKSDQRLKDLAVIEKEAKLVTKDYLKDVKDQHISFINILPEMGNVSYTNNLIFVSKIVSKFMKKVNDNVDDYVNKDGISDCVAMANDIQYGLGEMAKSMMEMVPDDILDGLKEKFKNTVDAFGIEEYFENPDEFIDGLVSIKTVASISETVGSASIYKDGKKLVKNFLKSSLTSKGDELNAGISILNLMHKKYNFGEESEIESVYNVQDIVAQAKLAIMNTLKYEKSLSAINADLDACIKAINGWDIPDESESITALVNSYREVINSIYACVRGVSLGASKECFAIYNESKKYLLNMIMKVSESDSKYTCTNKTVLGFYENLNKAIGDDDIEIIGAED